MTKILLAGESWSVTSHHTKGFDTFVTSAYEEGAGPFIDAINAAGIDVDFLPNNVAAQSFPSSLDVLKEYDVCVLSDIGANTLQLPSAVFEHSQQQTDRLEVIRQYVDGGGALLMVGGYLSFQGIQAMANYRNTVLAEVLPVEMEIGDDREEKPAGTTPVVADPTHSVVRNLSETEWPAILGYHRLTPKDNTQTPITVDGRPLLTLGADGAGRTAAFATDMAPHWLPPAFMQWEGYNALFGQLIAWLAAPSTSSDARSNPSGV